MYTTWIVVARHSGATLFEHGDGVRRLAEIPTRGDATREFARRVASRMQWEAAVRLPQNIVLLAEPCYLTALRLALVPALADRVRVASNSLPTTEDRDGLRAMLAPFVSPRPAPRKPS